MRHEDPIIEEIREGRYDLSKEFDHDPGRFIKGLMEFNKKYSKEVARYDSKVVQTQQEQLQAQQKKIEALEQRLNIAP